MAGVNKAFLIGHLGRDPELRYTANGTAVCNFSIATSEKFTRQNGDVEETTEWHNITVWNKPAEASAQYLSKGSLVCVEGKITREEWEDREGHKRNKTIIVAHRITFLGGQQQQEKPDEDPYPQGDGPPPDTEEEEEEPLPLNPKYDDDIPF